MKYVKKEMEELHDVVKSGIKDIKLKKQTKIESAKEKLKEFQSKIRSFEEKQKQTL